MGGAILMFRTQQPAGSAQPQYTQLTNFADSAHSPALSPDGRAELADLVRTADHALLSVKRSGKNQLLVAETV